MTDPIPTEECPVCPTASQTPGCGFPVHHVDESVPGRGSCSCGARCPAGELISRWFDKHVLAVRAAGGVAALSPVEVLPARCRSPHPQKVAACGRRQGHPGSHQDGDVVWRSVGTEPVRELPDRVTDGDLEQMVVSLYDAGAWCGDCDYGSGPCASCRVDLLGYAVAVLRVVGIQA